MLVSIFLALFLPCAGMSAIFLVYVCLLCHSAVSPEMEIPAAPVKGKVEKGLSPSDLEKLPKVNGRDLVLGTDCVVCLDEIESHQPAKIIPGCNHGFHADCADAWLSKNNVCPVCRARIGPELLGPPDSNPC
ncbi:E3 ubiquitin-protein ligase ATL23 [Andrographis paniculata]|uniref:E3 ubiquitin-protein ligase ATL23 n=1 Tax=Andrographis paniculata TaxID=175694 RepID=UPI0021E78C5A|nr:E3 ubiquitin-protein ligase ATL23 [Andrographis paniculata]